MTPSGLGSLLVVVAATTWGFMPLLARVAYADGASVSTVLFVRFGVAGLVFLTYVFLRGGVRSLSRRDALELGALGMAQAGIAGMYFTSLRYLPAALAALGLYTYPALAHALSYLLGREAPAGRGLIALGLASTGLLLSFLPGAGAGTAGGEGGATTGEGGAAAGVAAGAVPGGPDARGIGLALGAAFLWALVLLRTSRVARRVPPLEATGVVAAGTAAVFLVAGAVSGGLDFRLPGRAWLAMGAMGAFSTILGGAAYFAGLARVPATRAAVLTTVEPVVTALAAAAFLGERLSPLQLGGGALVVAGAALAAGAPAGRGAGAGGGMPGEGRAGRG